MTILIKKKINTFNKSILVDGDKSISIRWALLASQALGKSRAYNLLRSEDVINTIKCLRSGDIAKVRFTFLFRPEYIENNSMFTIR